MIIVFFFHLMVAEVLIVETDKTGIQTVSWMLYAVLYMSFLMVGKMIYWKMLKVLISGNKPFFST